MLTRSPVPSPSASPSSFHTTFHYAPASPQRRSPKLPTAVSRRQSTSSPLGMNIISSAASTSQTQPQPVPPQSQSLPPPPPTKAVAEIQPRPAERATPNYVAVDASTQYSPMEPYDYYAPRNPNAPIRSALPLTNASPPHPAASSLPLQVPQPQLPTASGTARPTAISGSQLMDSASTALSSTPALVQEPPMLKAPHPMSPNKRRNSQEPEPLSEETTCAGQGAGVFPKRVKPDTAPPKVLPARYELCTIEDIVVLIANMLSELIRTNDALALRSGHLTRFHSRTAPGISVLDYLHRLAKHATLTPPLLLSMVYYIDRLCALYSDFTINTLTVHRFLITAATVAAKGLSDSFWNNSTYARVGGVRVAELKLLELEFLHRVDWKIVPDPDVLVAYYRGLVQRSMAYVLEDEVNIEMEHEYEEGTDVSDVTDEDEVEDASESETSAQDKPPDWPQIHSR